MTTSEAIHYINTYKAEVDRAYVSLDIVTDSLLEECKQFIQMQIKEKMEYVVIISKPEITHTLSNSKLQQMKSAMNQLIEDVDTLMKELFYSKKAFNHRQFKAFYDDKVEKRDNISVDVKKEIEKCIRCVIGHVSNILIKFEYMDTDRFKRKDNLKADTFIYMADLVLSRKLSAIIDRYIDEFEDLYDYIYKVSTLQREIEQLSAKNLWDNA